MKNNGKIYLLVIMSQSLMVVSIDVDELIRTAQKPNLTDIQLEGISRFFCYGGASAKRYMVRGRKRNTEEYRDVLKVPKELKDRIRKYVLQQKDEKKKRWMEESLFIHRKHRTTSCRLTARAGGVLGITFQSGGQCPFGKHERIDFFPAAVVS